MKDIEKLKAIKELLTGAKEEDEITERTHIICMNVDNLSSIKDEKEREEFASQVRDLACEKCDKLLILHDDTYKLYLKHKNPLMCIDCMIPGLMK